MAYIHDIKMKGSSNNKKSLIKMSVTPLILSYFAEKEKGTRRDITKTIFSISLKLNRRNIDLDAVFRGNLSDPQSGSIQSNTVDEDLNYWLSNDFLGECKINQNDDLCFEILKPSSFQNFKIEKLSEKLDDFEWKSEGDKHFFIETLKEEFLRARSY